jgi:hypothetical protein
MDYNIYPKKNFPLIAQIYAEIKSTICVNQRNLREKNFISMFPTFSKPGTAHAAHGSNLSIFRL